MAANKTGTHGIVWHFMNAQGFHEKVYGELESDLAFDCVPTQNWHANGAWQLFNHVAFNLTRGFQRLILDPSSL